MRYAHLIPLFPFLAFLINILFGRKLKKISAGVSILATLSSFALALLTFKGFLSGEGSYSLVKWLNLGNLSLDFGVTIDGLSCLMLIVVSGVGSLIQIYSVGYMQDDPRFSRFFAYLSLFLASMLGIVLSDNFISLFIFWEGVGLCSYLLISFWFEKPSAAAAGMKAFITTKIGDTGLLIGIFMLFLATGSLSFSGLQNIHSASPLLTIAALLIFSGAIGKSAQFPLHTWLPDAMEGPTPVSALIHAATMVTAGIYLTARSFYLFSACPTALTWVAYIGGFTAIFAASIATVNNDIKRILAYSTVSQLGLMIMGLGVGGYSAGIFHMMTHAFFKALLFLCAGSIIHGVHTQDIREMGGLLSKMKVTGATLIIAGLTIAGVPPFSGFWSKDEILSEALHNGHPVLFTIGIITSFLTAFYMFRLIFLVLFGKARGKAHAHESSPVMFVPLIILAFCSIFAGFAGSPFTHHVFQSLVYFKGGHHLWVGLSEAQPLPSGLLEEIKPDYLVMLISTIVAVSGIALAGTFYIFNNKILSPAFRAKFSLLHKIVSNKYYIDELYEFLFIKPALRLGSLLARFDTGVIDAGVNAVAAVTVALSNIKAWVDVVIVDGLVNGVAKNIERLSKVMRRMQAGFIQGYLQFAFYGLLVIILIEMIELGKK